MFFFLIPVSIAETAAVMELKYFLPKELLLSLMDLFILVDILFSNAVLNSVFCLVVNNNLWDELFPLNILIFILKFAPVWFLAADFNLLNCEFDNLMFAVLNHLYYSQNFDCSFAKF